MNWKYLIAAIALMQLMACVPQRKYIDLKDSYDQLVDKNDKLLIQFNSQKDETGPLKTEVEDLTTKILALQNDTSILMNKIRMYETTNQDVGTALKDVNKQLELSIEDRKALSLELENKRQELYRKEEELKKRSTVLSGQQADFEKRESDFLKIQKEFEEQQKLIQSQSGDIANLSKENAEREKRVKELEAIISNQQEEVQSLENKISEALVDFSAGDLAVTRKDGKVYVSLQSKLLFKSGSKNVEARGKEALGKVAQVLNQNRDIDIIIEGHTDNVGGTSENWDLSVLRATSVVKLLIESYGVDPSRVLASGRGKHLPVASNDSDIGRQQNRRIEIILSPKLDQLYNAIGK